MIALVTGDADFVPLIWALKRRGIRVGVFGFHYKHATDEKRNSSISFALRSAAHFWVDVAALAQEQPEDFRALFARGRYDASRPPPADGPSAEDGTEEDASR